MKRSQTTETLDLNHVSVCKVPSCDRSRLISNVIQSEVMDPMVTNHAYILQSSELELCFNKVANKDVSFFFVPTNCTGNIQQFHQ